MGDVEDALNGWRQFDDMVTENGTMPIVSLIHGKGQCSCCTWAWRQIDKLRDEIRRLHAGAGNTGFEAPEDK